jgi:hypothetical protein
MHSTAFSGAPVGVMENHGRYSPFAYGFCNSPHSHSRDLENSHISQPRAQTLLRPNSHFSYLTYGYYCFLFIYNHTYPLLPVAPRTIHIQPRSPCRKQSERPSLPAIPYWLLPIPCIPENRPTFPRAIYSRHGYNRGDAWTPLPAPRKLLYSGGIGSGFCVEDLICQVSKPKSRSRPLRGQRWRLP